MEDDQLTRQRAMDAAAAVAVAAAAAAHQNQHHQQQHKRQRRDSDLEQKHIESEEQRLNGFDQGTSLHNDQFAAAEAVESVRKLQQGDEAFAEDSMQYVEQNGDITHIGESQSTSNRPAAYHTKRRKVNTCLPCKRRKVKCDREKPYCGQCKKHNFPASECTWSAAVMNASPNVRRNSETAGIAAVADAAAAEAVTSANASASGSQWYEMSNAPWTNFTPLPVDQSTQALASRVAELEAANAALTGDARSTQGQWDVKGMSEVERGMAADALAMIAQTEPEVLVTAPSEAMTFKGKRLLPSNSTSVPSEIMISHLHASSARTREIVALLPEMETIRQLVDDFVVIQEYGLHAGVNTELLNNQIDLLQTSAEKSDGTNLDLSFVAALFYVLAFTVEVKDDLSRVRLPELHVSDDGMAVDSQEMVTRVAAMWAAAGQYLLTILENDDEYNLNMITALTLKHHYLNACGRQTLAQSTLVVALNLCDSMGILSSENQGGSESLKPIFLKDQSPLLLAESARMIYQSLVVQYVLQSDISIININFELGAVTSQISSKFLGALFQMANDVGEARQSKVDLQTLKKNWSEIEISSRLDFNETAHESTARKHSQSIIFKMLAEYHLTRLCIEQSLPTKVESARQILQYRQSLEGESTIAFKLTKMPILQQMTLEAAFSIILRIESKNFEGDSYISEAEMRGELINANKFLSTADGRQNIAQSFLRYFLDSSEKPPAEEMQSEAAIFNFLEVVRSGKATGAEEAKFWRLMKRRGVGLLQPHRMS